MTIQHISSIAIYETPFHFYVIGSDPSETRFCTLKIDRLNESEFIVGEPNHEYTKADVGELLATISSSSIVTPSEKWSTRRNPNPGLIRTLDKALGIIGAVKFLEGYYLLVVTKARVAASIGHHVIYKVEDVSMIYLLASGSPVSADEQRYAKLFQTVDMTTDFYFSYTYDLSRNLQENVLKAKGLHFNKTSYSSEMTAENKFVWNEYLLEPFRKNDVSKKWTVELVHGYVAYQIVELPFAKLTLAVLARRSSRYAGTRFLKRGTNFEGHVANDVETEQIVWDMNSSPSLITGRFSGFVQRRGSVPLFWSQDPATRGVVGKPPIYIDLVEPHGLTTAAHFKELRRKYSHPIMVINLVKRREKRHHENLLHEQFLKTVKYLNEFRKPGRKIDYISFDVAKCNKTGLVLPRLEQLGLKSVLRTGWFQSFPELMGHKIRRHPLLNSFDPLCSEDGQLILQHGLARTNCVDCLDRTNVAQYGIGRIALGFQLYGLGYVDEPWISVNGELCRAYEDLFDEHGDTLALQYAGSQLVHSIKTYKKTSAFQERSRDVIQTISRYYSNTFNDFEKQNGINLFLGIYKYVLFMLEFSLST
ncbi:unnamed protein product [Bursaphelenchus xylophilus]|uniref:(pine wood nematode) hypothetical protein n=1 Tax=Bursaphelenchus xylophilus TaxID=6326 RepID=A0A1I7SSH2_BURXY|nr:unnamed protein product [Bursaphelenchus xylophilus]CAG9097548.1 unnamed protein product [Bursaphelenchus xylophilus]